MAYQFLILDRQGNAVAHGISKQIPKGTQWQLVIDDGDVEEVVKHTDFRLVCDSDAVPALEGRLVSRQGNTIVLEPIRRLEQSLRQNLRLPVSFHTYIYPISGTWRGREAVVSRDLSCGGVAFYCPRHLEVGEKVQIVIPITSSPLLMDVEILRCQSQDQDMALYAGQFVDPVREEESMVCEAVFGLQLKGNVGAVSRT